MRGLQVCGRLGDGRSFSFHVHRGQLVVEVYRPRLSALVPLPEDVVRALVSREGRYGPYLALAEACELNSKLVAGLAESLDIPPLEVNKAHLSALAWAQSIAA